MMHPHLSHCTTNALLEFKTCILLTVFEPTKQRWPGVWRPAFRSWTKLSWKFRCSKFQQTPRLLDVIHTTTVLRSTCSVRHLTPEMTHTSQMRCCGVKRSNFQMVSVIHGSTL